MPKVIIDQDACSGSGDCAVICDDVFEVVSGVSRIVAKYREKDESKGTVPEDLDCVYKAEKRCPVDAITVD